jgi:hypothetical protein
MKCLKSNKTGNIIRVSDKDAYNATSNGNLFLNQSGKNIRILRKKQKKKKVNNERSRYIRKIW